ncbi:MAG: GldG family protein [Acidobacteria bacterium]|nr:GldG family protein [Acidobacteriota bacterium]
MVRLARYASLAGLFIMLAALLHFGVVNRWNYGHWLALTMGGVLVGVGVALNLAVWRQALRRRQAAEGIHFFVTGVLLLVVLLLLNLLAVRHNWRWDSTPNQQYSLSAYTVQVLQNLEHDVHLRVFLAPVDQPEAIQFRESLRSLLREYSARSPHIHWQMIDPDRQREQARRYNIQYYNTIVVECPPRVELVEQPDESVLTGAILKVVSDETKRVFFSTGHGERSPANPSGYGFSLASAALQNRNYELGQINLLQEKLTVEECRLLIIAGPKKEWALGEIEAVEEYVRAGGALLVMVDPPPDAALATLLKTWGVQPRLDRIYDDSQAGRVLGTEVGAPLVTRYPDHPITRGMPVMTIFPSARSLERVSPWPEGITLQYLLRTNPGSWSERDSPIPPPAEPQFNPGTDLIGPLDIGFAVERVVGQAAEAGDTSPPAARLVVVGDSDFVTNAYFNQFSNGDLFLNMVNWLTAEEDLIAIQPRDPANVPILLTEVERRSVYYLTVIILPLVPLLAGIAVLFFRRRRR